MTMALDNHLISIAPLSRLTWFIGDIRHGVERAWRDYRQAAVLRRVDRDTLSDIGFSADYVRAEWKDFAADHPSLVAPAPAILGDDPRGSPCRFKAR